MKNKKLNLNSDVELEVTQFIHDIEAKEYKGCRYEFDSKIIIQRTAKITPMKTGQFVTLWQRDKTGVTCPLRNSSTFDFVIIICRNQKYFGYFLFPKEVLHKYKIISSKKSAGKRGFRVYPPWDRPESKQAHKTQSWQLNYFHEIEILSGIHLK